MAPLWPGNGPGRRLVTGGRTGRRRRMEEEVCARSDGLLGFNLCSGTGGKV